MSSEIASLHVKIGVDYKDLQNGLTQVSSMLSNVGSQLSSIGRGMTIGITLPLVGIGVAATKSALELDRSMRNIQSISKQSESSLMELRDTFLDMSTDMTKTTASANELAEGFYQIQSSGFAGADAMQVLEAAAMAGSAGLSTTAVAAEALTAGLNAYGESADQAGKYSDIMFRAVDIGVMSFEQLAGALSNVLPTAAATGIEFEQVAAAMSTMTKQGMSASEATTALNQVLLAMLKPSEALSAALADLGYESGQAALDALGLQGTLEALTDAGYDTSTELGDLFNNVRALRGALMLTGTGMDMFESDLKAMANASGATAEAFAIQMQSVIAQMDNLKNTAVALGIEMFDAAAPALRDMMGGAKDLVDAFRELDPEMQKNIIKWGGLVIAAGPFLTIVGQLMQVPKVIGGLVGAFGQLEIALQNVGLGMAGFGGLVTGLPAGLVAATFAIGGIAAAIGAYTRQTADMARAKAEAEAAALAGKEFIDVVNDQAIGAEKLGDSAQEASNQMDGFTQSQWDFNAAIQPATYQEYLDQMRRTGQMLSALSSTEWQAAKAMEALQAPVAEMTQAEIEAAAATEAYQASLAKTSDIMQAAGVDQALQVSTMEALSEAAGMATEEIDQQAETMLALSAAVNAGIISEEYFGQAMLDAFNNTGLLNDAQLDLINTTLAAQEGYNIAAAAMGNYASSMYSLAGSFENAKTAMDMGEIAMQAANQMFQSGAINGFQYADMMKSLNDQYGMFSEQSLKAATGMMQLNQAVTTGAIDTENYGDAYAQMLQNVEEGKAPMEGIIENFGSLEEKMQQVGELSATTISDVLGSLKADDIEGQLGELAGWMDTTLASAKALDGQSVEMSFKTNASEAMAAKIQEVNEAMAAASSTEVTHTVNFVYNYIINGSPPGGFGGGGVGSWSNTGGQFSGGDQYDPGTMSRSSSPTDNFSTTSLLPTDTLTAMPTATTAPTNPTYVSQDTYNIYNPLAAAIIADQKHLDRLQEAQEVLSR